MTVHMQVFIKSSLPRTRWLLQLFPPDYRTTIISDHILLVMVYTSEIYPDGSHRQQLWAGDKFPFLPLVERTIPSMVLL